MLVEVHIDVDKRAFCDSSDVVLLSRSEWCVLCYLSCHPMCGCSLTQMSEFFGPREYLSRGTIVLALHSLQQKFHILSPYGRLYHLARDPKSNELFYVLDSDIVFQETNSDSQCQDVLNSKDIPPSLINIGLLGITCFLMTCLFCLELTFGTGSEAQQTREKTVAIEQ